MVKCDEQAQVSSCVPFTYSIMGPPSPKNICIIVVLFCNIYVFFIFTYFVGLCFYIFTNLLLGPCWHHSVTCCESLFEYLGNDFWVHQSQKMFPCSSKWSTFYGWNVRVREQDQQPPVQAVACTWPHYRQNTNLKIAPDNELLNNTESVIILIYHFMNFIKFQHTHSHFILNKNLVRNTHKESIS